MAMSHWDSRLEKGVLSSRGLSTEPFEVSVALHAMSNSALLTLAIRRILARSSRLSLLQMA